MAEEDQEMESESDSHRTYADAVRVAVSRGVAATDAQLRASVIARAAGGRAVAEPFDALANQIAEAAYRVTDAQVADVCAETGSEAGAFEIIMAASIGAGLARWDAALRAIGEASNASD